MTHTNEPPGFPGRFSLTQALDRSQNYNLGRHALGVLGKAQPPDLFSLERRAALRRSPRFSVKFISLRARLRPTRIWQWFAESHAGAHAPPCGSPRACVQSVLAGLRSRCLTCAFNNRLVRSNNSFKPTPFRCVACVRSLRSHASPHRSRRGLTQALCGGHKRASLCWQSIAQPRPERRLRCDPGSPGLRPRIAELLGGAVRWPRPFAELRWVIPPFLLSRA